MRWFSSELGLSIILPTRARVTIVNKRAIFNWVSKVIQVCLGITSVSFVSLPRKLVPPAHPMRFYQPWANYDLITRAFPLFRPFPSIISEFPLAVCDIYICPDWLLWLPWCCCDYHGIVVTGLHRKALWQGYIHLLIQLHEIVLLLSLACQICWVKSSWLWGKYHVTSLSWFTPLGEWK